MTHAEQGKTDAFLNGLYEPTQECTLRVHVWSG